MKFAEQILFVSKKLYLSHFDMTKEMGLKIRTFTYGNKASINLIYQKTDLCLCAKIKFEDK